MEINQEMIDGVIFDMTEILDAQIKMDNNSFASLDVLSGVMDKTFSKLKKALSQKTIKNTKQIRAELLEVGTAVIFGLASLELLQIELEKVQWAESRKSRGQG